MSKCDDEHHEGEAKRASLPKGRDGVPWKAGELEAGAEDRMVDEEFGWEVYKGKEISDGLLRWSLSYGKCLHAA